MKKVLLFSAIMLISTVCFSQDIISLKSGKRVEVIVTEITPTLVRYKLFSSPNGKVYFMYRDDVQGIMYQNGKVETFNYPETQTIENNSSANQTQQFNPSVVNRENVETTPDQSNNYSSQASVVRRNDYQRAQPQNRNNYYSSQGTNTIKETNSLSRKGKKAIGLNVGYGTDFIKNLSVGVKFNYNFTDQFQLSPSFNYYLPKDGFSVFVFDADLHYLFDVASKLVVYPLAGVNFSSWNNVFSFSDDDYPDDGGSSSDKHIGLNLGGGFGYELSDNLIFGLELKYWIISNFNQLVPSVNLMYKF